MGTSLSQGRLCIRKGKKLKRGNVEGANSGGIREREGEGVSNVADTSWLLGLSEELECLQICLCLQWSDSLPL